MDAFLVDLRRAALEQAGITLLNVYKGVPIAFPATVLSLTPQGVMIRTEKYQIVCLHRERETFLQLPQSDVILRAHVVAFDVLQLTAILFPLEPVRGRIGIRTHVRVQPRDPIPSEVRSRALTRSVSAELADISQHGVGIYLPERAYSPQVYGLNTLLKVSLRLPGDYRISGGSGLESSAPPAERYSRENVRLAPVLPPAPMPRGDGPLRVQVLRAPEIDLEGQIVNLRHDERRRRYRLGIQVNLSDTARSLLAQFISQRQSEIIREIRDAYELLAKGEVPPP